MNTRRIKTIPILFGLTGIGLLLGLMWVSAAGSTRAVQGVAAPAISRPRVIKKVGLGEAAFPSNLTLTTAGTVTCTLEYTTTTQPNDLLNDTFSYAVPIIN